MWIEAQWVTITHPWEWLKFKRLTITNADDIWKYLAFLKKLSIHLLLLFSNSTSRYLPKRWNIFTQEKWHRFKKLSIRMFRAVLFITSQSWKQIVVYSYNWTSLAMKRNKLLISTTTRMNLKHYAEPKKPDMYSVTIYMKQENKQN